MTNTPSPTDEDRELIEEAFALLCRKYVQRADERQKGMGLQYTEAETRDLAATIAKFTRDRLESLLSDRAKLEEALRSLIAANERTPMHLRMPYEIEPTENAKRALHG